MAVGRQDYESNMSNQVDLTVWEIDDANLTGAGKWLITKAFAIRVTYRTEIETINLKIM